jgi:2-dehydro-3-deoxygalactonokinase
MKDGSSVVLLEGETTNTSVWLVRGDQVVAEARTSVGARDTARDGSPHRLEVALNSLVSGVRREGEALPVPCRPAIVVAAGMLTSSLGLRGVEHVPAPAGVDELAARVERHSFPSVTDLPVVLVPGVRSGPTRCERTAVGSTDVIRGEETTAIGLHLLGWLPAGGIVLSLGSHWKAIHVDRDGRITSSVTSLGGELLDVVTSQTVLAGSLPRQWPAAFDHAWVDEGVHEVHRSGFARALFCVRLLEQRVTSTPDERLAYLIGVAIGSVMDTLLARRSFRAGARVLVTGQPALAHAFAAQLRGTSVDAMPVSEMQAAHAVRTGMLRVLGRSAYATSRSFSRAGGHVLPLVRPASISSSSSSFAPADNVPSAGSSAVQPSPRRRRRPGAS